MGYTVNSVSPEGEFEILGRGLNPIILQHHSEAEERAIHGTAADRYFEPSVMFNNSQDEGAVVGLQPFWAKFTTTTHQKLQAGLDRARDELLPIGYLKVVHAIGEAFDFGLNITNIVLLGSGSMHVGGTCVCCEHRPDTAADQIAEAIELSKYFGSPGNPLPLAVQDPAYSRMEKNFLEGQSIKVYDDPDAFGAINSETLVIGYGVWYSVWKSVFRNLLPAALLCYDVPTGGRANEEETADRVQVFDKFAKYRRLGFHDEYNEEEMAKEMRAKLKRRGECGKNVKKALATKREIRKKYREQKKWAPCLWIRI